MAAACSPAAIARPKLPSILWTGMVMAFPDLAIWPHAATFQIPGPASGRFGISSSAALVSVRNQAYMLRRR